MNPVTYIFEIVAALVVIGVIIELLRRSTLRERHAVWWLFGGVLALVVAVFPRTLRWAARLLGITLPTNLVFFVAIALLFLVTLQYGAELTRLEAKTRALAEKAAFHDLRLRQLEAALAKRDPDSRADSPAGVDADTCPAQRPASSHESHDMDDPS